jgi:hypothetical protein
MSCRRLFASLRYFQSYRPDDLKEYVCTFKSLFSNLANIFCDHCFVMKSEETIQSLFSILTSSFCDHCFVVVSNEIYLLMQASFSSFRFFPFLNFI